jgi:hypothetical protein
MGGGHLLQERQEFLVAVAETADVRGDLAGDPPVNVKGLCSDGPSAGERTSSPDQ